MKKIKIIIVIVILIIGIELVSYGTFNYLSNKERSEVSTDTSTPKDPNSKKEIMPNQESKYTLITNYTNSNDYKKELCISNFSVLDDETSIKQINFDITNNTENVIKNKKLKINFYNENKLINTFEYEIEEIGIKDSLGIETSIEINDMKITKYEFEFDGFKTDVVPN